MPRVGMFHAHHLELQPRRVSVRRVGTTDIAQVSVPCPDQWLTVEGDEAIACQLLNAVVYTLQPRANA